MKVMAKRKVGLKRNFSTQNLGFSHAAMPVCTYINENITPMRRKLLAAAHAVKKEKGKLVGGEWKTSYENGPGI